jgi:prepilin-type N-terminal cleavage/methylation domain-containing protein
MGMTGETAKKFQTTTNGRRFESGHSLIELLIVVALIAALSSLALPQLLEQQRLTRSVGIGREIMSHLRDTRQLAMSQRQAFTFVYNNTSKTLSIIDHNSNPGGVLLTDPSYPNTAGSQVVLNIPMGETAITTDMRYGIPSGLPAGALSDGTSLTALVNNLFTVTFQPDGSVIDSAVDPQNRAIFIYNNRAAQGTASAVSVLGAAGRVKIWRYDAVANLYAE